MLLFLSLFVSLCAAGCTLDEDTIGWNLGFVTCSTSGGNLVVPGSSPAYKVVSQGTFMAETGDSTTFSNWPSEAQDTANGQDGCSVGVVPGRVACVGLVANPPGSATTSLALSGSLAVNFAGGTFAPGTVRKFPLFRATTLTGFFSSSRVSFGTFDPCITNITYTEYTEMDGIGGMTFGIRVNVPACPTSTTRAPSTTGPSISFAPTTRAPTTRAPSTTGPSISSAPTTRAPTTRAPSTTGPSISSAPTTRAPTTGAPTTGAPTTQQPSTGSPTFAPTTLSPTVVGGTFAPTTARPTEAPTTERPTVAPTTQAPTTLSPTVNTQVGGTFAPTTLAPTTDAPTSASPTTLNPTGSPTEPPTSVTPTCTGGTLQGSICFCGVGQVCECGFGVTQCDCQSAGSCYCENTVTCLGRDATVVRKNGPGTLDCGTSLDCCPGVIGEPCPTTINAASTLSVALPLLALLIALLH